MNLARFLCRHGIAATRHEHPAVMTVEESVRLVPKLPGAKTKNLFLRDRKGKPPLPGHRAARHGVDLDALGRALGVGRPGLRVGRAAAEASGHHARLGQPPRARQRRCGAVEFVIDRSLWDADAVQAHPLDNTATMVIPHASLERFLAATGHPPRVIELPAVTVE